MLGVIGGVSIFCMKRVGGKTVNLFLGRQCQKNEEFQAALRRHVSEGQK